MIIALDCCNGSAMIAGKWIEQEQERFACAELSGYWGGSPLQKN